jgi:hypothetical protein
MNALEMPLELALRKEATQRLLQDLYDDKNLDGLMAAAELLNQLWHQQSTAAKWFAKEAGDNLAEAWQAGKVHRPEHDGSGC